ncbi:hypothetical protein Asal01_00509 [Fodinibius salicampi]
MIIVQLLVIVPSLGGWKAADFNTMCQGLIDHYLKLNTLNFITFKLNPATDFRPQPPTFKFSLSSFLVEDRLEK